MILGVGEGGSRQEFVNERLVDQTTEIFDRINKLKLGTFSTMQKTVTVQTNGNTVPFSAHYDIFGKMALIQQRRDMDLKEMIWSCSICTCRCFWSEGNSTKV